MKQERYKWIKVDQHKVLLDTICNEIVHVLIKDTPQCSKADEGILPDDEMKKVYQWIILNKEVLLNHWNLKVDSIELCQRIKKLE